jgi:hypothetical protein
MILEFPFARSGSCHLVGTRVQTCCRAESRRREVVLAGLPQGIGRIMKEKVGEVKNEEKRGKELGLLESVWLNRQPSALCRIPRTRQVRGGLVQAQTRGHRVPAPTKCWKLCAEIRHADQA